MARGNCDTNRASRDRKPSAPIAPAPTRCHDAAPEEPLPTPDLIDRLAAHRTIGSASRGELAWIAAQGRLCRYDAGEVVNRLNDPVAGLYLVLSGHLSIHVNRGAGPRKVMEWLAGDVTGLLPYSRLTVPPGDVVAEEPSELLLIPRDDLQAMIRECPEATSILVHVMVDRARHFTSADLQDEKMLSLGRLSAGIAHELNNPASAMVRSASLLAERIEALETAARALGASLSAEQFAGADGVIRACTAGHNHPRSAIEQADREEAITTWLEAHGVDGSAAAALAESAVTPEALDAIAAALDPASLGTALEGLAESCAVRAIVSDIGIAAERIHALVAAIRRFTYMDREPALARVDVGRGIRDTLAVLQGKARAKSVRLTVRIDPDLPPIEAYGGELNQLWANLIDNAFDAVGAGGAVEIEAASRGGAVLVRVIDDGPGIPESIRGRIFDPFFTTKPVGQGTGLGLDLVRRLVARHHGDIDVDSRPGRTEFRITLPGRAKGGGAASANHHHETHG